ncbi:PREDICTED: myrosinase 1-like [Nicrophorus vespilloides]|uniref:Myrosinase 1-like n=1 Tax=Nicrophorus vespilloides TaxID=110193 RepID=A0ABM1N7A9_NICVS|nr:PREDICTED: myrosinase 1-like [Nicrophorus vespilloides]
MLLTTLPVISVIIAFAAGADYKFPNNFKFGVATASYQIEGGWKDGGKGESIWDYQTHTFPNRILDGSNGDIACDSYNKIDEDIRNLKALKVDFYRFSISWPRLLPSGFANEISEDGVRYYNELIDKLIANGIEPMVTLYHWDVPQSIENLGGWTNRAIVDYFGDYARICFKLFGDRVKTWITINEPYSICEYGYGNVITAPYYNSTGIGSYACGHHVILSHAKAYNIYAFEFRFKQRGRVGITVESSWWEPDSNSKEDRTAAENMMQMYFGWFLHPIIKGDYPPVMRLRVDKKSREQHFPRSRLPRFTIKEIIEIKGTIDFLGLNHYTTFMAKSGTDGPVPSNINDVGAILYQKPEWKQSAREVFRLVPWGLRKLLVWVKKEYRNIEVLITENGYAGKEDETTNDIERIEYYNLYLTEVLKAIHEDKCKITGYTAWSFMDNYEWTDGYTMRFGMYYVDFKDPNRTRTPKKSAFVYQNIVVTKKIDTSLDLHEFLH